MIDIDSYFSNTSMSLRIFSTDIHPVPLDNPLVNELEPAHPYNVKFVVNALPLP